MALAVPTAILIAGFFILIKGADLLVKGASSTALILKISESAVALTVVENFICASGGACSADQVQ